MLQDSFAAAVEYGRPIGVHSTIRALLTGHAEPVALPASQRPCFFRGALTG